MQRVTLTSVRIALLSSMLCVAAVAAPAQDTAVVNADITQVKVDNPQVRVIEAVLEPGVKEKMHSHPATVVYVVAGGTLRLHNADGTTSEATLNTGDSSYRGPVTHWAENIGETTVHLILVELKSPG